MWTCDQSTGRSTGAVGPSHQLGHDRDHKVCLRLSEKVDLDGQDGAREDAREQLVHRTDLIMVSELPEAPLLPLDMVVVRQVDDLKRGLRRAA